MQYTVYEGNMKKLEAKLQRVENKCKKYGASFKYDIVGEEFRDVEFTEGVRTLRYVIVDVEGFAKVNGWEFVATIDHHGDRNVVRHIVDCDIPDRYWTSDPYCEHCKTLRRRNDTFLIHNVETDEFKQVGRSCLRDFTGGYDADLAASYIAVHEYLIQSEEASESCPFFGGFTSYHDLKNVMIMSKVVINKLGFVSSSSETAQPSKHVVEELDHLLTHGVTKYNRWLVDEGVTRAYEDFNDDAYIEAVKKYYIENEENSSFMQNMKTIFSSDYCKIRDYGYIVAAIFTYDRNQEKARQAEIARQKQIKENEVSQYVGEIKQKITFKVKECKCVSSYDNGYVYGMSYLYKFVDVDGNVFMWSTSNGLEADRVESVTGTVKDHKEYRGLKQTWITRCKVTEKLVDPEPYNDAAEKAFEDFENYMNGAATA